MDSGQQGRQRLGTKLPLPATHTAMSAPLLNPHARALPFLDAADEAQPGAVPTAMLRLSAQLAARSEPGCAAAVEALAGGGAHPDALRVACLQALDAGAPAPARQALQALLDRCARGAGAGGADAEGSGEGGSSVLAAPGYEAVLHQNLIRLHLVRQLEGVSGPTGVAVRWLPACCLHPGSR